MSERHAAPLVARPAHAPPDPPPAGPLCPDVLDLSGLRHREHVPARRALTGPLELYLARVGAQDGWALRRARELLDAEEQARALAFRRDRDRDAYVVAHAALRSLLSALLGTRAEALPLMREPCAGCGGPHGRPALRSSEVHFSLSHSEDLVLVALAPAPVGVDVEGLVTAQAMLGAQSALHVAEARELTRLPSHDRPAAFTRAWVRKEAYLKGLGTGLVRDPALDYVGTGPLPTGPSPGWTLRDVLVPQGYAAAVALRTP